MTRTEDGLDKLRSTFVKKKSNREIIVTIFRLCIFIAAAAIATLPSNSSAQTSNVSQGQIAVGAGPPNSGPSTKNADDINSIAQHAIEAARETTETIKWVFGVAASALALLLGAASWLGWQSLQQAIEAVKTTATSNADNALALIRKRADEKVAATEARLSEHLMACNLVCVNSLETVRFVLVAEQWSETKDGRAADFKDALQCARDVQKYAKNIEGLERSYVWAIGMDGYISAKLGNYDDAIEAQLKTIALAPPEKLRAEYHYQYNLACYCAKSGRFEKALDALNEAIRIGGEEARLSAWKDDDLKPLTGSAPQADRVRTILGTAPVPETSVPAA